MLHKIWGKKCVLILPYAVLTCLYLKKDDLKIHSLSFFFLAALKGAGLTLRPELALRCILEIYVSVCGSTQRLLEVFKRKVFKKWIMLFFVLHKNHV